MARGMAPKVAAAAAAVAAAVVGLVPCAWASPPRPTPSPTAPLFPTAAALRSSFAAADYAIDTNTIRGPRGRVGSVRPATVGTFPLLGLPDVDMALVRVTLAGGAHGPPHTHPRSAELLYLLRGTLDVYVVEENPAGAPRARVIANTLAVGGMSAFPRGLVHGQRCVSAGGCEYIAALNAADPGSVAVAPRLCDAPMEAVAAALGVPVRAAARACGRVQGGLLPGQPQTWRPRRQ